MNLQTGKENDQSMILEWIMRCYILCKVKITEVLKTCFFFQRVLENHINKKLKYGVGAENFSCYLLPSFFTTKFSFFMKQYFTAPKSESLEKPLLAELTVKFACASAVEVAVKVLQL